MNFEFLGRLIRLIEKKKQKLNYNNYAKIFKNFVFI